MFLLGWHICGRLDDLKEEWMSMCALESRVLFDLNVSLEFQAVRWSTIEGVELALEAYGKSGMEEPHILRSTHLHA